MDIQELRREAQTMQPQLTADRRRLHRNPELLQPVRMGG